VLSAWGPWRTAVDWWAAAACRRDEWDVALSDGAVYRIFRDRDTERWFVDAIVD
jgi:protein ImuB